MKYLNFQNVFSVGFLIFGGYQLYLGHWLEASLYILASLSFIFNALASQENLQHHKKVLVAITWGLMITTVLLFIWFLQFKKYI